MTDQNKQNLTSSNPEVVTEYTLCDNFIRQYKKHQMGMLRGSIWTVREEQAIIASMIGEPEGMLSFITATAALIVVRARDEFDTEEEVLMCVSNFHSCMYIIIFSVVIPLLKLPDEEKEAIRNAYIHNMQKGPTDPFANLDFKMDGTGPEDPRLP